MNGDWSYWLREHKGTLLAFAAFVVMFTIYAANHPMGLNANVATTAANKGVLLAIVAMAQTLVVLTSGIDLSVGMVMVLANCLASSIVVGSPLTTALGVIGVLLTGCLCGAINGLIVIYGRLQPIVTTIATGAVYYGIALALRPVPGGDVNASLADALTGQLPGGVPASLAGLLALVAGGFFTRLLVTVPLPLDFGTPNAMPSAIVLLTLFAVALYAFRISLGTRPVFNLAIDE